MSTSYPDHPTGHSPPPSPPPAEGHEDLEHEGGPETLEDALGSRHPGEEPDDEAFVEQLDGGLPEEIEEDLMEQLGAMDHASSFHQDGGGFGGPSGMGEAAPAMPADPLAFDASMGLSRADRPVRRSSSRWGADPFASEPEPAPREETVENIEDLYHAYPKLSTGEYQLRVVREKPRTYGNKPCAGFLKDLTEPVSMAEFQRMFGGGSYTLNVMGGRQDRLAEDGGFKRRTLARLRISISGAPRLLNSEEDMTMGMNRLFPDVQKTQLELQHEEKRYADKKHEELNARLETERERRLKMVEEYNRGQLQAFQEVSEQSMGVLKQENGRLRKELEEKSSELRLAREAFDRELREKSEEVYRIRQEQMMAAQKEETDRIRELKERHARDLEQMRHSHAEKVDAMREEWTRRERDITDRAERERRDATDRGERERNTINAEHERRMDYLQKDHERALASLKETYEARIREAEKNQRREIETLRDSFNMQIESIRTSERATAGAQTNSVSQQAQWLQIQLEQVRGDLARKEEMLEHMRMEQMSNQKGVLEQVQESKNLLGELNMLGGGDKQPEDFKSMAVQLMRNVSDNLPDIIKNVSTAREQGRQNAAAQAAQEAAVARANERRRQAMLEHQRRQHAGLPAAPPPAQPRVRHQPPPGMSDPANGPMDPDAGPVGASPLGHSGFAPTPASTVSPLGSRPSHGPVHYMDPTAQYGPQESSASASQAPPPQQHPAPPPSRPALAPAQEQAQPSPPAPHPEPPPEPEPPSMGPPVAPEQAAQQAPPQPPAAQPTAAEQAPAPPPPPELGMQMTDDMGENIQRFLHLLDKTIEEGVIGPRTFAAAVVRELGPEQTAAILGSVSAQHVIDVVESSGMQNSSITTMDGQEYLEQVWAEGRRLVEQAKES